MDPICTAALATFRRQERGFLEVIAGLSNEAMNWRPGAETNSIAVLVAHTWGSAQMWTARASGTAIERDRAAEFRVAFGAAEGEALIRRAGERVAMFVGAIDPATYGDARADPDGEHDTVAKCLIHALEHTQEHYGHACLTRQMWEQQRGSR
jgi:uncharacterized damage-inducible protein DinB